jgi:hypothetical protein
MPKKATPTMPAKTAVPRVRRSSAPAPCAAVLAKRRLRDAADRPRLRLVEGAGANQLVDFLLRQRRHLRRRPRLHEQAARHRQGGFVARAERNKLNPGGAPFVSRGRLVLCHS